MVYPVVYASLGIPESVHGSLYASLGTLVGAPPCPAPAWHRTTGTTSTHVDVLFDTFDRLPDLLSVLFITFEKS